MPLSVLSGSRGRVWSWSDGLRNPIHIRFPSQAYEQDVGLSFLPGAPENCRTQHAAGRAFDPAEVRTMALMAENTESDSPADQSAGWIVWTLLDTGLWGDEPSIEDRSSRRHAAVAIGAIRALHEYGIQVGKDVSVCAINDDGISRYLCPSLTCFQLPENLIGYLRLCVEWMLRDKQKWDGPLKFQADGDNLFIGESTNILQTATDKTKPW